jgi:putative two-component system response regulator
VGKIGIPDGILLKPGKLTAEEFDEMKKHTSIGAGILSGSKFPVLQLAEEIALYHHENWDGSGYMRMDGELIPRAAQIVHAADVFDALTHERPYKHAWSVDEALDEIRDLMALLRRRVVDALLAVHDAGRLEVDGAPPPIAHIFRTPDDIADLAARAREAEARSRRATAESRRALTCGDSA